MAFGNQERPLYLLAQKAGVLNIAVLAGRKSSVGESQQPPYLGLPGHSVICGMDTLQLNVPSSNSSLGSFHACLSMLGDFLGMVST